MVIDYSRNQTLSNRAYGIDYIPTTVPMGVSMLSLKEVAEILKVHPNTIRKWIAKGKIEYTKIGRQYRFNKEYIEKIQKEGLSL